MERDSNLTKYLIKHSIKILFDVSQGMSWDRVMRAVDWKWIKAQLGFFRSSSLSVGGNWILSEEITNQMINCASKHVGAGSPKLS